MNLRFDCFVWNNWSALVNTEFDRCITASIADMSVVKRSTSEITSVNTGTGVCEKRRPRSAHECVSANLARRARCRALCGRGRARRRSGVAA